MRFKTLDVLVFSAYGRRERVHGNVTATPTAAWVWRQLLAATPWGSKPRQRRRERDAVSGRDCRARARRSGIDAIATPVRSPRAHAVAERVMGTRRRACLDHLIGLDEPQLSSVLSEVVADDHRARPPRTLSLQTPAPRPRPATGPIRSRLVLNGLHHVYERAA